MGEFFLNELVNAKGVGYGVNNLTVILMGLGVVFAGYRVYRLLYHGFNL